MHLHPRRVALVAALASTCALAGASAAGAATPVVNGRTLTITGDPANAGETITLTVDGATGQLALNGTATGLTADDDAAIVVNAAGGADTINASALARDRYGTLTVSGGGGDDLITGGADNDTLLGDAGNDRVIGAPGNDDLEGGAGNDQLVWNNGDGTDTSKGDAGNDEVEVNGAATVGDVFTIAPADQALTPGGAVFRRVNLGTFAITMTAERLTVNGLGGSDSFAPDANVGGSVAALTSVTLNGGSGADALTGGDGADLINGGEDDDRLTGGPGDDRVVGDRGADQLNGGDGDDVLVWNNGDGSDTDAGDAGFDRVEVNGASADDVFTLAPDGAGARFARTNVGPFTIALDAAMEAITVNGFGGADALTVSPGLAPTFAVTADGGSGNDTLTGAGEADSLFGSSGDDVLTGGGAADLLDGGENDDRLLARDGSGDLVRGGAGIDAAQTDEVTVDAISGVEALDATQPPAPPTVDRVAQLPRLGAFTVVRRRGALVARVVATCPASEAGGCRTTLTLQTAKAVKLGKLRAVALLGSKRVRLAAGKRATVSIRLAGGAASLARHGKLAARVRVASSDASGNAAERTAAIRLSLPRR
jgi:Ca2+-binding RTX toxin-like protein